MTEPSEIDLDSIRAFTSVANRLGFRPAADELGVDATVVSRRIGRLETRLGVRLLQRTTRRVTLTDAGALFLRRCEDLLSRLADAEAEVSKYASGLTGTLRLAVPNVFGQLHVAPLVPDFMALHPDLRLELTFSDRMVDLVREGFDAAVRIGALEAGGDLRVRRLAPNPRVVCASPSYVARYGAPVVPADLMQHRILHFSPLLGGTSWHLKGPSGAMEIAIKPILKADNVEVLRQAAIKGQGIAVLAEFVAGIDLAAGRLVPLLKDWRPSESFISLVYPNAPFLPQKVRAMSDFLAQGLGQWRDQGHQAKARQG